MEAYSCKQCGKFTVAGYISEYKEHFCRHRCYEIHCAIRGYEVHLEKLTPIITKE